MIKNGILTLSYGNDKMEIELDKLNSFSDFIEIIATIKHQDSMTPTVHNFDKENMLAFDRLTSSEIGIYNFIRGLQKAEREIQDTMISPGEARLLQVAKIIGASDAINISPVDPTIYGYFTKLRALEELCITHVSISLSSRVGYDVALNVDPDGTVYVHKDLRKTLVQ